MWLAKQSAKPVGASAPAVSGTVTAAGERPAAMTDTEHRNLRLICPGGYGWVPADAEDVMVLRGAPDAVIGRDASAPVELAPGEVCIYSGGCAVILRNNGEIHLNGQVLINGVRLGGGHGKQTD